MLTLREMFLHKPTDEFMAKVDEDALSAPREPAADSLDLGSIEQLGTPPEVRNARPQIPPSEIVDAARAAHTVGQVPAMEPWDAIRVGRRRGFRGFLDSIEYRWLLLLLSLYGPARQTREADPIEQLKRKYGRPPSKY